MKLRFILLILSLLAFGSAAAGGFLYYTALQEAAVNEAEVQAVSRVEMIQKNLTSFLSENLRPVRALAGMSDLRDALLHPDTRNLAEANLLLDHFNYTLGTDVCYLMDREGNTVAASNRLTPESFVGYNFNFRPYFRQAIHGVPATYMAVGSTSGKRGVYSSFPVYGPDRDHPIGVAVIKASIDRIEKEIVTHEGEIVLVTSPEGVIFISSREDWRFQLIRRINSDAVAGIAASLQFGQGPWEWVGLIIEHDGTAVDRQRNRYQIHYAAIHNDPGWQVVHLRSLKVISGRITGPLIRVSGLIVLFLCAIIGLAVFFLYRKASREILRRRSVEKALRESDERYRAIYNNTPAMLHSVDRRARLVSVSDHWLSVLGYGREEVIGRPLADFLTPPSARFLEETVMPAFLRDGFCTDIPYRYVKKDGGVVDVLLSAIGERDESGRVIRSLAVSIDMTDRNRAEDALKSAKEELSRYSRDLERQVRVRTEEISGILSYTPDVIYIKDREGRYLMVNPRFAEIFGVRREEIRGKQDIEVLPDAVAHQFRKSDAKALAEQRPQQTEERIPHDDGVHTYLAVKFPIYDGAGETSAVGGILTDITAAKKARDQLRRLSAGIMEGQEKERAAIARELHDQLGQILTALRMEGVWLANRLKEADPPAADRARALCDLIDTSIEEVRGMAHRLRPNVLDDLGLVDALDWFVNDFERRTGIPCRFEHVKVQELDDPLSTAAYRIVQESLTNVLRHSFANEVDVTLDLQEGVLMLTVSDNGRGFNTLDLTESEGLGIAGMRERAGLVGGVLEVCSSPDMGTQVFLRAPVNGKRKGAVS